MKKDRSNLRLISYIVMLALVLTMAAGSTFSWYNRTKVAGGESNKLIYSQTGMVNNAASEERTVATYAGTSENGVVSYSETAVSGAVTAKAGEVTYFKTVITDTANAGDSMVSLYLQSITLSSNMGNEFHIGLVGPEKTYKSYTCTNNAANKVCVEDNIFLENNGTVEVYWFVKPDTANATDGTITLGAQYLVYN